jgi:uncharacterized protein YjbJ (UPF0337 family)
MQDSQQPERQMDEDRVKGAADKAKGKVESAIGGIKDAARDAAKH